MVAVSCLAVGVWSCAESVAPLPDLELWDGIAIGTSGGGCWGYELRAGTTALMANYCDPPPEAGTYCPNSDPDCILPLRSGDRVKIDSGMAFVDLSRAICQDGYNKVIELYGNNRIFRGNPLIPDDPANPTYDTHDAQSRRGTAPLIHVDENYLNTSAVKALAGLLLHEAWHLLGYPNHGAEESPPYTTYPYSEQVSCVP
jgi:hypothetical protein